MPQLMSTLITDILPRIKKAPKDISIYQAANSVQSLIYKKLLDRGSDLLATGQLQLIIPPFGKSAPLPPDFLSLAEKPASEDYVSDWMSGTVTSYNSSTGQLVVNITESAGVDTLSSWYVAIAMRQGSRCTIVAQSTTLLTVGTIPQTLMVNTGLTLPAGTYVFILPAFIPGSPEASSGITVGGAANALPSWLTDGESAVTYPILSRKRKIEPQYLTEDREHDGPWWNWYGTSYDDDSWDIPLPNPRRFKVVGSTFYIHPRVTMAVAVTGRYNQIPVTLANPTDVLPWNGMFYETMREGAVWIITKSLSMPDSDPAFKDFIHRDIDTVLTSRTEMLPDRRMKRSYWL